MKRVVVILMLACAVCAGTFAQNIMTIYVSARGNDDNDGDKESAPLKTLSKALLVAIITSAIYDADSRIVVIGTLNKDSEGVKQGNDFIFKLVTGERQVLVTGKPGASGSERAVLSGRDSGETVVVYANGANVRFEHIEISGGKGGGLFISDGSTITLGQGAVVRGNSLAAVVIADNGTACTINGGEVRDNPGAGILVGEKGVLTMRSGAIMNNNSTGNAGGVGILSSGRFTMSGGTISGNNAAKIGGGVCVMSGGRFDQTGGTISGNTAGQGANVYREQGALGSNLTPGSSGTASSGSSSSGSSSSNSSSSSGGFEWDFITNVGVYLQGLNMNTVSFGIPLQLGVKFGFVDVISIAVLGEIAGGMGIPYMFEYNYGGMAEVYTFSEDFGLGFGIGSHNALMPWKEDLGENDNAETPDKIKSNYYRMAVIFKGGGKTTVYGQYYNSGDKKGHWGLGFSYMF